MSETVKTGKTVAASSFGQPVLTKSSGGLYELMPSGHIDSVNNVMKVAEKWTAGTLTGAADGATITGTGVLRKLVISNGSGSAITVTVYDNTAASGTKLLPVLNIPALTTFPLDLAIPFTTGVYIDYSTATSCDGIGFYQAVN